MMFDGLITLGMNAPRAHQRIIRKLSGELHKLFENGQIILESFPETMIDESKTNPVPDLILVNNEADSVEAIIEITTTVALNKDFEKVIGLVNDYQVSEGFVYNYNKKHWKKYKRGIGEILAQPSFCDSIGFDLNNFV